MKQKMLRNLMLKLCILILILILISPLPLGLKLTNYTHVSSIQIENELTTEPHDLLIITPQEFTESLQELVDHKNRFGMKTKLVTLSEVYDNMFWHGRDNAEKIKYFIKESIENWGVEYVLLVGDFRLMPIRYVHNQDVQQGFNEPVFISELYYADIYNQDGSFSSWDTDNDAVFGEWYDDGVSTKAEDQPIDLYPDIAVGRLACRNKVEVEVLVDKIIGQMIYLFVQEIPIQICPQMKEKRTLSVCLKT